MTNKTTLEDCAVKVNGILALNNALGHIGALRFISLIHKVPTDYVDISRRLYEKQTVSDIFERAKKRWKQTAR